MPSSTAGWYDAEPQTRVSPLIALQCKILAHSPTNRARCCPGSHSFTEGGSRNPVSRSTSRKLLIPPTAPGAPTTKPYHIMGRTAPKSDRLLAKKECIGQAPRQCATLLSSGYTLPS